MADTPSRRAICASKLFAAIHLQKFDQLDACKLPKGEDNTLRDELIAVVPSIYRKTQEGAQGLVASGLASLLPHRVDIEKSSKGSIGRTAMLEQMLKKRRDNEVNAALDSLSDFHLGTTSRVNKKKCLIQETLRSDLND